MSKAILDDRNHYCPDCDCYEKTVCYGCLECKKCGKVFTKAELINYSKERLNRIKAGHSYLLEG